MATINNNDLTTAVFAPGAVTKNNDMALPAYYPEIKQILGAATISITNGTPMTWTTQALTATVYSATLSANQISHSDGNTIRCGNTTDASTTIMITYRSY